MKPLTQIEIEKYERFAFDHKRRRIRKKYLKFMCKDDAFGDYAIGPITYNYHMFYLGAAGRRSHFDAIYIERRPFDENFDIITNGYSDSFWLFPDKFVEIRKDTGEEFTKLVGRFGEEFTKLVGRFATFKNAVKWINWNGGECGKFTVYTPTRVYHIWNNLGVIGARRCMSV
jgi:hypothetical protein